MQKKRNILLTLILFLLMTSLAIGQANFSVTPQLIELNLAPGTRTTIKVLLSNETENDSQRFRIYSSDVMETEQGNYKVIEKGKGKFSCADWIKLDTMDIVLGPKKGLEIPFEIRVPALTSGARFGAIVFTLQPKTTPMEEGYAGASVDFFFQIPVQIEITIKSYLTPKPKNVQVTGIDVIPATEDKEYAPILKNKARDVLVVRAYVNNGGDIHIKARGRLIITDRKGKRLREVPMGAGRGLVLPLTKVQFTSVIKRPLAGDYVAEAVINYGGLSTAIGRYPFTIGRNVSAKKGSFNANPPIGLTVSREILNLAAPANGLRTQIISLTNEENNPVIIKSHIRYLSYDENGNVVALDTGDVSFSCIKWLTIEPNEFEIKPGGKQTVKVTLKVPEVTASGRYACLTFEASLKSGKENLLPTTLQIPFVLTVTGKTEKKGEITKVEVSKGNPPNIAVYFKNTSNIHISPKVKVDLKYLPKIQTTGDLTYVGEPKSELVGVFNYNKFPVDVLPGGVAKFEQDYKSKLEPGNYIAVITADFGGTEPVVFIQKFQVK